MRLHTTLAHATPLHAPQASPYFAALFERWAQHQGGGARTAGAAAPCVLRVTAREDVAAAVALLRCCYTDTFQDLACGGAHTLLPAMAAAGRGCNGRHSTTNVGGRGGRCDAADAPPEIGCWQQLAVRTLVLADRLDCSR